MKPTLLQQLDRWARRALPVAISLLLALLSAVPIPVPGYAALAPDLVLMAVFYWVVHRPDLMSLPVVFVIGLFADLVSGTPLGVNPLILILVHVTIMSQHRVFRGKPFPIVWLGFAVVAGPAKLTQALLVPIVVGAWPDPVLLLVQIVLTIALYPVLAAWFARLQRLALPAAGVPA